MDSLSISDPTRKASLDEGALREYAWDYFALHAEQRLKAFQFYISLATAVVGGFFLLLRDGHAHKWMAALGVVLLLLSFVFWKLDGRTRWLVKNAENALEFLDAQHALQDIEGVPHPLRLFTRDDYYTKQVAPFPVWTARFTYARCFRWLFLGFSLLGVVETVACLVYFPQW